MKKISKNIKVLVLLFIAITINSCDLLPLQEEFDFQPEVDLTNPFDTLTAWEFIQTRTEREEEDIERIRYNVTELNYMITAIKKAGFEELYNQTATTDRTYLLLTNAAFTGRGDIIDLVTGTASVTEEVLDANGDPVLDMDGDEVNRLLSPEEVFERVDTPEKLERLRTILRYHIVTAYVAQVPTLVRPDIDYLFQTLIPGNNGLISFKRDARRWRIFINNASAPLPSTANSSGQNESVFRHNYVFNNGVAHWLQDPVRNQPY